MNCSVYCPGDRPESSGDPDQIESVKFGVGQSRMRN
jgi:hypothetical protein